MVKSWNIIRSKKLKLKMKTQAKFMSTTLVESLTCLTKFYLFKIFTIIAQHVTFSCDINLLIHNFNLTQVVDI